MPQPHLSILLRQYGKSFTLGGFAQTLIQTHKLMPCGPPIGPHNGCGQLKRICSSKRMQEKHTPCLFTNNQTGLNLRPRRQQGMKDCSHLCLIVRAEYLLSSQSRHCGITFHCCPPPCHHSPITHTQFLQIETLRLLKTKRQHCRGIPEFHRPSARSVNNIRNALERRSCGLRIFQKPAGSFPAPKRTKPARARLTRCADSASTERDTGTSLAIGFPRSMTITSSPAFTFAKHALNVALRVDTAADFTKDLHGHIACDHSSFFIMILQATFVPIRPHAD